MAYASQAPFIWWSLGASSRLADGRFEQILTLEVSPDVTIDSPEAWLRIRTQTGFSQSGRSGRTFWYKCSLSSAQPWTLVIQSGEYASADVFARAEIEGCPLFAQTRIVLYGQGGETEKDREESEEGPAWPEFTVRSSGESYWPQTGHEFSLRINGETNGRPLEVHSGPVELAAKTVHNSLPVLLDTVLQTGDVYKYVAPHDPALNRAGVTAAKPLIFTARIAEGGTASFTQIVHRSRYAFWNKKAGLAVAAGSFLFSGLGVIISRRKRKLPCV